MTAIVNPVPNVALTTTPTPASPLAKVREGAAALLALIIAGAFVAALSFAFSHVGEKEPFTHAKELIGVVNGLMGVVLGYYFQKSSSETQIENAAKTADEAMKQAAKATTETAQAKDALKEVAAAAGDMSGGADALPPRMDRALRRADAILMR
jgi:septal ring-binding cell division protein DamX